MSTIPDKGLSNPSLETFGHDPAVPPTPPQVTADPKPQETTTPDVPPMVVIDLLKDANGAPVLAPPVSNLSADDMISQLQALRNESLSGQEKNAQTTVEKSRIDLKNVSQAQQDKIKEWIDKCEKGNNAGVWGKIFGWAGKIAAFLGAVAAVNIAAGGAIFSGGTASPLLVLACIGLVSATLSLGDHFVKEVGWKFEVSISNLATKVVESLLIKLFDVPEEKVKQIAGVVIFAALFIVPGTPAVLLIEPQMLGNITKNICELAGAPEKFTAVAPMVIGVVATVITSVVMIVMTRKFDAAQSLIRAAAYTQMAQGATQMSQGANTLIVADYAREANKKLVDKKMLEAFQLQISKSMESGMEGLKAIIQQLQAGVESVSEIINSFGESSSVISRNLGKVTA